MCHAWHPLLEARSVGRTRTSIGQTTLANSGCERPGSRVLQRAKLVLRDPICCVHHSTSASREVGNTYSSRKSDRFDAQASSGIQIGATFWKMKSGDHFVHSVQKPSMSAKLGSANACTEHRVQLPHLLVCREIGRRVIVLGSAAGAQVRVHDLRFQTLKQWLWGLATSPSCWKEWFEQLYNYLPWADLRDTKYQELKPTWPLGMCETGRTMPRRTVFVVDHGCSCVYGYSGVKVTPHTYNP
eukprot:3477718-Amphidinium_carterae.1